jgi:hypothetical protein
MTVGEQKFTCKVELSKTQGIAIIIRDLSDPQNFKQVLLEGASLIVKTNKGTSSATITQTEDSVITEVKTADGTTTITQGPEEVKVKCKLFTVEAETVSVTSDKDTSFTVAGAYTMKSTKDCTVETQADCLVKSTGKTTLDATDKTAISSKLELQASAPKVGINADSSLDVKSKAALNLTGAVSTMKGDMRAVVDAPNTTLGGSMTTLQGQMVTVSGSLIKLG